MFLLEVVTLVPLHLKELLPIPYRRKRPFHGLSAG